MRPDVFVRGCGAGSMRLDAGARDDCGANGDDCDVVGVDCVAGAGIGVGAGFGGSTFATTLLVEGALVVGCAAGAAGRGAGFASATTTGVVSTLSDLDAFEFVSCSDWG